MTKELKKYLHDLNNKIGFISGSTELLLDEEMSEEAKRIIIKMNKMCYEIVNDARSLKWE